MDWSGRENTYHRNHDLGRTLYHTSLSLRLPSLHLLVHIYLSVLTLGSIPQAVYFLVYTSEYTPCSHHRLSFYQGEYSLMFKVNMAMLLGPEHQLLRDIASCFSVPHTLCLSNPWWPTQTWTCGSLAASVWAPGSCHSAPSAASTP